MNQSLSYELSQVMPQCVAIGLFVSTAVFQAPDGTLTVSGAPSGTYVTQLTVACMDAPNSISRFSGAEAKTETDVQSSTLRHVLLDAYYPTIPTGQRSGWRCLLNGVAYDLMAAESDSQQTQTRCELMLVTV